MRGPSTSWKRPRMEIGLTRRGYAYCARQPETLAKAVAECEDLGQCETPRLPLASERRRRRPRRRRRCRRASTCSMAPPRARRSRLWPTTSCGVVHARRAGWVDSRKVRRARRSSEGGGRHVCGGVRRRRGVRRWEGRRRGRSDGTGDALSESIHAGVVNCVAGVRVDGRRVATSTVVDAPGYGMVSEMELPVAVNEVHAKCIFRDVFRKRSPATRPCSSPSTQRELWRTTSKEDVFGPTWRRTAAELTGVAPAGDSDAVDA